MHPDYHDSDDPGKLCAVLTGRKATCFFGIKDDPINAGAYYPEHAMKTPGSDCATRRMRLRQLTQGDSSPTKAASEGSGSRMADGIGPPPLSIWAFCPPAVLDLGVPYS